MRRLLYLGLMGFGFGKQGRTGTSFGTMLDDNGTTFFVVENGYSR